MALLPLLVDTLRFPDLRARATQFPIHRRIEWLRAWYALSDDEIAILLSEERKALVAAISAEIMAIDEANLPTLVGLPPEAGALLGFLPANQPAPAAEARGLAPESADDLRRVAWPGRSVAGVEQLDPHLLSAGEKSEVTVTTWFPSPRASFAVVGGDGEERPLSVLALYPIRNTGKVNLRLEVPALEPGTYTLLFRNPPGSLHETMELASGYPDAIVVA